MRHHSPVGSHERSATPAVRLCCSLLRNLWQPSKTVVRLAVRAASCASLIWLLAAILGGTAESIRLVDIAASSGLTLPNTFGGKEKKTYILESTGNGVAIFDYDGDGSNDILITNGTTLEGPGGGVPRTLQLYRNDGRGKFTDVSREAGFTVEGWAQGVCVGDYDNDGKPDLLVTYYGHN